MLIKHLPEHHEFVATVNGIESHISYSIEDRTFNLLHTIVPYEISGHGIAGEITKHVIDWAKAREYKVNPVCSYTKDYLKKHPELL
ncbi:GNAT family N-acetyltransferase [Brackiella oedipodis]|uniref:GNAT family N-acetyltransferase n=1 Tax=Brackiella oedipodis TaxID=124225 RepID=UPI00048B0BBF|nr:GNAT family N-acetyltransferase [Brackiella oedipodis]